VLSPTIEEEEEEEEDHHSVQSFGELEKVDSHQLYGEFEKVEVEVDDETLVDDSSVASEDLYDGGEVGGLRRKKTFKVIIRSRAFL
jgi:myosin protein heavy chain